MSEQKHTPGPWKWRDRYDFREHQAHREQGLLADCDNIRSGRIELVSNTGAMVLQEWAEYADDAGLEISIPNAHLIAAAPEMYEALQAIKETVEGHFDDQCEYCRLAIDAINAALAKAEGRS